MESNPPRSEEPRQEWPQRISPEMRRVVVVIEDTPHSGITSEMIFRKLGATTEMGSSLEARTEWKRTGQSNETDITGPLTE